MTPCNYIEFVVKKSGRVKSSSTWPFLTIFEFNLSPFQRSEVKNPHIIQVCHSLAPKDNQVRKKELSNMVGSFPRCFFTLNGGDFGPNFGLPVENTDGVEPALGRTPSPKNDNLVVNSIIVHGAVGPLLGNISCTCDFRPCHGPGIEAPNIIHVNGV